MKKKIAFTGHRPDKLPGGWDGDHSNLIKFISRKIEEENISDIYVGGALGLDQIALEAALHVWDYKNNYTINICEPFPYFWRRWRPNQIEKYMKLKYSCLGETDWPSNLIHVDSNEEYQPYKMHRRNEFMVNEATELWAWWNGNRKGGTYACVKYAFQKHKSIINLYKEFNNIS